MKPRQLAALLRTLDGHPEVTFLRIPALTLRLDPSLRIKAATPKREAAPDLDLEDEDDEGAEEDIGDPRFALEKFYDEKGPA
jgi:hypothetical protein